MSRNSAEKRRLREKRAISATIGYCFVTVLVVLLVMSSYLSDVYIGVLRTERAATMKSLALACSTTLNYTDIHEGMQYPLPEYCYAENKPYTVDIYTRAGNSYIRLYSSDPDSEEDYTLSGAGDDYNTCFEEQTVCLTKRTDKKVNYVCAIAPIISSENTVSGIIEIRMPSSDFESTVNGMSLSWIFTIFAIAVSMGIFIFEINLLVTSMSAGYSNNVPQLFAYGENAVRFLSFFMAFSSVMQPIILSSYIKDKFKDNYSLGDSKDIIVQLLILVALLIFVAGFFGFKSIKKSIKFKITSRISIIAIPVVSYLLSLVCGLVNNLVVTMVLVLPISFASGFVFDYLRDYRINAASLRFEDFNDSKIHSLQNTSHFLGIAVGTVVAGVCYERFGILVVTLISGACLILTAIGLSFFFKSNNPRNEQYVSLGNHLEMLGNHYLGGLLLSAYLVLGFIFAFILGFVPNFLETVGITLATSSFYYLICAFVACFIAVIIRNSFSNIMSTKVKVTISSSAAVIGLLLFALLPTAKVLVVTVMLLGLSLGMNDFTYLYALAYLAKSGGISLSVRRLAEKTFVLGICFGLFVNAIALSLNKLRIVFIVTVIILVVFAFMYPVSSVASLVDSVQKKTVAVKPKKKQKVKKEAPVTVSENYVQQPPVQDYVNPQAYNQTPYPTDYTEPEQSAYPNAYAEPVQQPYVNDYSEPVNDNNQYTANDETSFLNDNPFGGDA
ncbi:MAG: hypothetical protein MJ153_03315 [Clostridia bacterium]|nr:hypothetical protein [Clostridia bacterium]